MRLKRIITMIIMSTFFLTSLVGCKEEKKLTPPEKIISPEEKEDTKEENEKTPEEEYNEGLKESAKKLGIKDNDNPENVGEIKKIEKIYEEKFLNEKTEYDPLDGKIIIRNNAKECLEKYNLPIRVNDLRKLYPAKALEGSVIAHYKYPENAPKDFFIEESDFYQENGRKWKDVPGKGSDIKSESGRKWRWSTQKYMFSKIEPFKGLNFKPSWSKNEIYGLYPMLFNFPNGDERFLQFEYECDPYFRDESFSFQADNPFDTDIKVDNSYAYIFSDLGHGGGTEKPDIILPHNITSGYGCDLKRMIEKFGCPHYYYDVSEGLEYTSEYYDNVKDKQDILSFKKVKMNSLEDIFNVKCYSSKMYFGYDFYSEDKTKFAQLIFYFDAPYSKKDDGYTIADCYPSRNVDQFLDRNNALSERIDYLFYDKNIWKK